LIVVDASLFVAWLLNERDEDASDTFWRTLLTQPAAVPAHWPNEVANALRRAVRMKRLPAADVEPTARELFIFDIKLAAPPVAADIAGLAMDALSVDLSVYDLQYIRLAQTLGVPLATGDAAMRIAAERMNVTLFPKQQ
jgi:predicted nucleic acid-binding protein